MKATELKPLLCRGVTLALSDGNETVTSSDRGVKPLVELIESGRDYGGFVAADKIVGRAAVLLYALLGVKDLYAEVISDGAILVCEKFGIAVSYGVKTERIINRTGDGVCPMEQAVAGIDEPHAAYIAVKEKLKSLKNNRP